MSGIVKKSSFIEGTIITTLAIIITKIMGMLYVIPFYAMVGSLGSALYAYAYNIYIIFLDISSAGLPIAMSKIIKEFNTLEMFDAKQRAYEIGKKMTFFISTIVFLILFIFAEFFGKLILGNLSGGNTIEDVTFVIRAVSFAILVIPFLGVSRGYLQGHNIFSISSISQLIEQVVRILVILGGSYLAIYIFHLSLKKTIGIAVIGAFMGGLFAITYLLFKIRKNKQELGLTTNYKKDKITDKEIGKKIITYAIPFIIIAIAASINDFLDMVMLLRTLEYLKIETAMVEFATTAITTWSTKICMIVNSIAVGMATSLIPTIVGAFTLKNWSEVNDKVNKALQLILLICIPMCVGISLLSESIWSVFYGLNVNGTEILRIRIFISLVYSIYTITTATLQALNKFTTVYKSTITGFIVNMLLNVPLMLLFNRLGNAYIGAIIATIIGYTVAFSIALKTLKKEHSLNYKTTLKTLGEIMLPIVAMVLVVVMLKLLIPVNLMSRLSCVIYIGIISISGGLVYFIIAYKMGLLNKVLGSLYMNKIRKKLTFGKC